MERDPPSNPFVGLRAFQEDEDDLFFGRRGATQKLLRRLRTTRFLPVIGASGSGKSSLVRAGLIPSLYGGFMVQAGSRWRVAILNPGEDPFHRLASALARPEALGERPDLGDARLRILESTLRSSGRGLIDAVRQAHLPQGDNLIVVVDQFEELFRFKRLTESRDSPDVASAFVKILVEASKDSSIPLYVAFTLRADFIGQCMEFPGFTEAMNEAQYLVPRMNRDELRSASTGPVAMRGAKIAPRLLVQLLNEIGDHPDQLPLMQHALMRTWEEVNHEAGESLDLHHYKLVGRMESALSLHAEEAYTDLLRKVRERAVREVEEKAIAAAEKKRKKKPVDADKIRSRIRKRELVRARESALARVRHITPRLFQTITTTDERDRGIRRPASIEELQKVCKATTEEIVEVADAFRTPGRAFLTPHRGDLDARSILDISHESLMRLWGRLVHWVEEEKESADLYRRLSDSAARHERGEESYWRKPQLQAALEWRAKKRPTPAWAARYGEHFDRAMHFLDLSLRAHRLRRLRLVYFPLVTLGVALFVLGSTGKKPVYYDVLPPTTRLRVEKTRDSSGREEVWLVQDSGTAIKLDVREPVLVKDGESGLPDAGDSKLKERIHSSERTPTAMLRIETTRDSSGREQVWLVQDIGDPVRLDVVREPVLVKDGDLGLPGVGEPVLKERIHSTDGYKPTVAMLRVEKTRDSSGREQVWLVQDIGDPVQLDVVREPVLVKDGDLGLPGVGEPVLKKRIHSTAAPPEACSPKALELALRALQLRDKEEVRQKAREAFEEIQERQGTSNCPNDPDHPLIYAGLLRSWNLLDPSRSLAIDMADCLKPSDFASEGPVRALAVGRDGKVLATGSEDGRAYVFDAQSYKLLARLSPDPGSPIRAVSWSPNGEWLAAGRFDGSVQVWRIRDPIPETIEPLDLIKLDHAVHSLAFDKEGIRLAVGSSDGLSLWRFDGKKQTGPIRKDEKKSKVTSVVFDGDKLAAAGSSGARFWESAELEERWRSPPEEPWPSPPDECMSVVLNGNVLGCGTAGGDIVLWGLDGEAKEHRLKGHQSGVTALEYSATEQLLASASLDGTLRVWKWKKNETSGKWEWNELSIVLSGHDSWVWSLAFSADGKELFSGGEDRTVRVWKTRSELLYGELRPK